MIPGNNESQPEAKSTDLDERPETTIERPGARPLSEEVALRFHELIHKRWDVGASRAPADVFVVGREIWVEIDLPGVTPEEVRARIEGGELAIEATRRLEPPSGEARPARLERPRGFLQRRIALPRPVIRGRVELTLEAGVLRVRVQPEEKP